MVTEKSRKFPLIRRGTWGSFIAQLLVVAIMSSWLFSDHPVHQRFFYANILVILYLIYNIVRDLVTVLKGEGKDE